VKSSKAYAGNGIIYAVTLEALLPLETEAYPDAANPET
jgi:hypothetical protein